MNHRHIIAILRGIRTEEAVPVCTALADAGITMIEVPLNSPNAVDTIALVAKALSARADIGAGTAVMSPGALSCARTTPTPRHRQALAVLEAECLSSTGPSTGPCTALRRRPIVAGKTSAARGRHGGGHGRRGTKAGIAGTSWFKGGGSSTGFLRPIRLPPLLFHFLVFFRPGMVRKRGQPLCCVLKRGRSAGMV